MLIVVLIGDFYWLFINLDEICVNSLKYFDFYWLNMWK